MTKITTYLHKVVTLKGGQWANLKKHNKRIRINLWSGQFLQKNTFLTIVIGPFLKPKKATHWYFFNQIKKKKGFSIQGCHVIDFLCLKNVQIWLIFKVKKCFPPKGVRIWQELIGINGLCQQDQWIFIGNMCCPTCGGVYSALWNFGGAESFIILG